MKNLKSYDDFLFELTPAFGFDGCELKVGKSVISFDGYSGIIISKEDVNGHIQYRTHKGEILTCESANLIEYEQLNEDLTWWEVTKGILAADAIKAGVSLAGGGILVAGYLFANWRKSIANKIESIRKEEKFSELKNEAAKIAEKFNTDEELKSKLAELAKYPYVDTLFLNGKREISKAKEGNKARRDIMKDIAKHVKSKLTPDEQKFFTEINSILRDKPLTDGNGTKIEEDAVSDPNRMVGTGTSTPVRAADQNPTVGGSFDTTDPASAGTVPTYVS